MPRLQQVRANWYDWPQYYDLALQGETKSEADFVEQAARRYCQFPARRLLEPGCGSGRLVRELAARGYDMWGMDLSCPALRYAQRRLAARRLSAHLWQGDMASFRVPGRFDVAYNFCNTFRHLLTEQAARNHLESVARSLRPGGLYLLGLHLLPYDVDPESIERWTESNRGRRVTATLRVIDFQRRRRIERLRISLRVTTPRRQLRLVDEFDLRIYTAAQMRRLLASVPHLQLVDVFDFWYDLDEPLRLNDHITDAVLILRKVAAD